MDTSAGEEGDPEPGGNMNPNPSDLPRYRIAHVPQRSRFELHVGDDLAGELHYTLDGTVATMYHTEVFPEFGGRGGGAALVHAALEAARDNGWTVVPACSFVRGYIRAHREYADLV